MRFPVVLFTSIFLPLLTSCGGGTQVAEGGIGGTGITSGKVSGYGSIFVNGVEFETSTALFLIEEEESGLGEETIKLGMVVQVTGEQDGVSGTATKVEYSNLLKGIITATPQLDADGVGVLEIMRQTVHVDQTTIFNDAATTQGILITDLVENDVIEVSGFSDGLGSIYATRIELTSQGWTTGDTLDVKGVVTNLTSMTFDIGGLRVDFSGANLLLDGNPLQEGRYVEVTGVSFTIDEQFVANEVELEGDGDLQVAADGEEVELEGIVTSPLSGDLFSLNGQPVSILNLTIDATEIIEGRELEVEGSMVDGILEASEITFGATESELQEMSSKVELVEIVDINTGTLFLYGQAISVTPSTIMQDELGDDRDFNLAVLLADQYVEVDVYHDVNGLVALKLERKFTPIPMVYEIEGLVEEIDAANPNLIWVLGVLINIAATGINPIVGDRVDILGSNYDGTTLIATSGAIE